MHDYYRILNIPPTATLPEIKLAYHTLLLKHHPDKNVLSKHLSPSSSVNLDSGPTHTGRPIDIALLKEAYITLSSSPSRSDYDISLRQVKSHSTCTRLGPRPAQIVSLEDFTQLQSQSRDEEEEDAWEHPCRCGGTYRISESDMDKGQHLVGCRSCSEVIWVGYELVDENEDGIES